MNNHSQAARLRQLKKGFATRDRLIELLLADPKATNAQLAKELGLGVSIVKRYLAELRRDDRISVTKWLGSDRRVHRKIRFLDAVSESKVSQQGTPKPGSDTPESHPKHHESVLRDGGIDPRPWWDVGSD